MQTLPPHLPAGGGGNPATLFYTPPPLTGKSSVPGSIMAQERQGIIGHASFSFQQEE